MEETTPPPARDISALNTDVMTRMMNFLDISEVATGPRAVSSSWDGIATQARKALAAAILAAPGVRLRGLTSAAGRRLNGAVGTLAAPRKRRKSDGRFPVNVRDPVTGETGGSRGVRYIKLSNLQPATAQEVAAAKPYTTTSRVKEAHGRALEMALGVGRFEVNQMYDRAIRGPAAADFNLFRSMPLADPRMQRLFASMWTYWNVIPGRPAGMDPGRYTLCDTVIQWLLSNADGFQQYAEADGVAGNARHTMLAHVVRAMRVWETERLAENFYIVRDVPYGTLMVSEDLERVYLVRGIVDKIAGIIARANRGGRQQLVHLTLLPLCDMWTPVEILPNTCFRSNALYCTAMAWILILA